MPISTGVVSCYALINLYLFFYMARQPPVGRGLLIHEVCISHSDTPHSVGLLWMSEQFDAAISLPDNTQHSLQTDMHVSGGIRTYNPSQQTSADLRLRPRGCRDRQMSISLWKVALLRLVDINAPFEMLHYRRYIQLFCNLKSPNKTHNLMAFKKRY